MVNWNNILTNKGNRKAVVNFVEGALSLKSFQKTVDTHARTEFAKISVRGADDCRRLARKALRRRSIRYSLTV